MKILLVGQTPAPTQAFALLAQHLNANGHHATVAPNPETTAVEDALVVLIGLSSPAEKATLEIEIAKQCLATGKAFGFYADTHGAWRRKHFEELLHQAAFLFVVNEKEAYFARAKFPEIRTVVATGNPLWGAYFETPRDRSAARQLLGAQNNEFVILAPGTKTPSHNILIWSDVIQAAENANIGPALVVVARHPGESKKDDSNDQILRDLYLELAALGTSENVRVIVADKNLDERMTSDNILDGADVVVNGTALRIHALAKRIAVIDYFPPLAQAWLERDIGSRFGPFYGTDAVIDAYGQTWLELKGVLELVHINSTQLLNAQARTVELVTTTGVLRRMQDALEVVGGIHQ